MVDLIPAEYRQAMRLRRLLKGFTLACIGIAIGLATAFAVLSWLAADERAALGRFQQLQVKSRAQEARLAELTSRKAAAQQRLQTLDALRGKVSIGRLAEAFDAALNERIWFQEIAFTRAGDGPERKAEPAAAPAKDKRPEETGGALRAQERVEVRGLAGDHAVLADFIRHLGAQPAVRQVKLLDTSARNYPNVQVVDFQLAAQMGGSPEAAR